MAIKFSTVTSKHLKDCNNKVAGTNSFVAETMETYGHKFGTHMHCLRWDGVRHGGIPFLFEKKKRNSPSAF
jgi:hypothetical protein